MRALLVLFAALAPPALAQAPASAPGWSLDEVLGSLDRHPNLLGADAEVASAEGAQRAARGAFDPVVRGSLGGRPVGYYQQFTADLGMKWQTPLWGASFEGGWRLGQGEFAAYEGKAETLGAGELYAGLSLPLLAGGPLDPKRGEWQQTALRVEGQGAEREALRLDLAVAAESAYWQWVASVEALRVAERLLALAETRSEGIRRRVEEGAAPSIDGTEFERSLLSRRGKVAQAEAKAKAAAVKLSLYARDAEGRPRVPGSGDAPSMPVMTASARISTDEAADQAWSRRPESSRWAAARRDAEVEVRVARAQVLPALDLKVLASADVPRANEAPSQALLRPTLGARLDLEVPVGLRTARGKLESARGKAAAVEQKARWSEEKLEAGVRELAAAMDGVEDRLSLAQRAVQVGRDLAVAEARRYELGASDLLLVNLREQAVASAEEELVWLRAELLSLRAAWSAMTGGGALRSPDSTR